MSENTKKLLDIVNKWNLQKGMYTMDASINEPQIKDISNCITARYDAGIQNQKSIGMVVVYVRG